jgi:lysophospholipase L1-like esterase
MPRIGLGLGVGVHRSNVGPYVGDVYNLLPLGDSITAGTGTASGGGYREPLWDLLHGEGYAFYFEGGNANGPDDISRAHNGTPGVTALTTAATATSQVSKYRPRIILLHIGINDIIGGASAQTTCDRIVTVVGNCAAGRSDYKVLLLLLGPHTTSGFNTTRLACNDLLRAVAWDTNHVTILENPLTTADLADTTHPNATTGAPGLAAVFAVPLRLVLPKWR